MTTVAIKQVVEALNHQLFWIKKNYSYYEGINQKSILKICQ